MARQHVPLPRYRPMTSGVVPPSRPPGAPKSGASPASSPRSGAEARRDQTDLRLLLRVHRFDDDRARAELARRFLPMVRSFARRYTGRGEDLEDLTQVGFVGLVKAIDRFDPDAGYRFVSFAVPNITGEIRRHFRDRTWALHVPRAMQELDARVRGTEAQMTAATGREPTDQQLADALGTTTARIDEARSVRHAYRTSSTSAPALDGDAPYDVHGTPDAGYRQIEDHAMLSETLTVLDDRQREVVRLRFQEELLQREIGAHLGISQMQVSRILAAAIARMRDHLRDAGVLLSGDDVLYGAGVPSDRRDGGAPGTAVAPALGRAGVRDD